MAYNTSASNPKSLYYFDSVQKKWVYGILSEQTPKVAYIDIVNNTSLLDNTSPGGRDLLLKTRPVVSPVSNILGVKVVNNTASGYYGIILPQGSYMIEVNLNMTATNTSPNATNCPVGCSPVVTGSDFYVHGYFVDAYQDSYNNLTNVFTPNNSVADRNRKETSVISKLGINHFGSWVYKFTVPQNADSNMMSSLRIYLGRMSSSNYNDIVNVLSTGSFIKIQQL